MSRVRSEDRQVRQRIRLRNAHGQRVRRMAELGRDASGTDELGTLLDQLAERSTYEHQLTLAAATPT